jgi:hypothetical protein
LDTQAIVRGLILAAGAVALGACGGGETNKRPLALAQSLAGVEDAPVGGQLSGSDPEGKPLTYVLVGQALKGRVSLDSATGAFTYTPDADTNGADSFSFATSDGKRQSLPAVVALAIAPVNDSPTLGMVAEARNSAETLQVRVPLNARDVDGDVLSVTVAALDPAVVAVDVATDGDALVVTPLQRGITDIEVVVSDGSLDASARLKFEVGDVIKRREWSLEKPRDHAIALTNVGTAPVSLRLRHNMHEVLNDSLDAVRVVQALEAAHPDETVDVHLWRYLSESTYWWYPVTAKFWAHDPVVLLNSIGYGFCDDVANALAILGQEMGLRSRVWYLQGHVVPEVEMHGLWKMYDPSLRVHYRDAAGATVGVAELSATPELIISPTDPVITPPSDSVAYSPALAAIYESTSDNTVVDQRFSSERRLRGEFELPVASRFTYPGAWVDSPAGVEGAGPAPVPALLSAQGRLDLPAGFAGPVQLPFVLWSAAGQGVVRISGVDYEADSAQLATRLRSLEALPENIEVSAIGNVSLIYLVNPIRFSMLDSNVLDVESIDAWAVDVELTELQLEHQLAQVPIDALVSASPSL